jgi:hypothetical protein
MLVRLQRACVDVSRVSEFGRRGKGRAGSTSRRESISMLDIRSNGRCPNNKVEVDERTVEEASSLFRKVVRRIAADFPLATESRAP